MVLELVFNILHDFFGIVWRYGEACIACLPMELVGAEVIFVNKFRRGGLNGLDKVGEGFDGVIVEEDMDVVGGSTEFNGKVTTVINHSGDEGVEAFEDRIGEVGFVAFCGEYEVEFDFQIFICHNAKVWIICGNGK